ncbi:protein FAM83B-like [Oncorhynchus kisutch]|uniref:Family with sequence similarity 83 member B n=1 Tax=Oncorhynchus kisutch TaxID=8019 RepID=A0A8C7JY16_ONCKI|nr:protein FAM83B-like [Oncorhynchus kisutch]
MMESEQLSLLSSLKGELQSEDYIHPHYKEAYRLAIDSLVNGGRESYQEFLKAERIGSFLSEDEIHFITTNASHPLPSSHTEEINGPALDTPASKSSTGTYWPVHSDIVTPNLELGWPMVMHDKLQTNIDLLFHPARLNSPTIKEVIRKQIQGARQVIAIVMDIFTDVDIFKEAVDASIRGTPVYVLLDEFHLQSFLSMAENQDIQIPKLRNMRVRTVKGQDYICRTGATFHGAMEQKFLLVDCQTVVYGSYSFMWSYEKINLSMVQVITGQLVESYDEEFRTLFARSSMPAVLAPPEGVLLERNGRHALAKYASQSSQAFERKDQLRHTLDTVYSKACERQMGMTSPIREMEERLYEEEPFQHRPMVNHGVSVQKHIHQFQSAETANFLKRHSYAGERQEVLHVPHNTRYGASNWNVAGDEGYHCAPGRSHFSNAMDDNSQGAQMYRGHNIRQSYHGNDKHSRSMQQNIPTLEHTAKSFLSTYRIESYLNNTDTPIGESCDYLDQYEALENKARSFIPSRVRSSLVFKSTIPEQPETNSYSKNSFIRQVDPSARQNNATYYSSMQRNPATSMENRMRQDEFIMKKQSLQILDDPRNNIGYGPGRDPHQSVYASLGRTKGGLVIKNPELLQDNWHKRHSVADPKSNIDYRDNKESSSHMYGGAFVRTQADSGGIRVGAQNGGYSSNLIEDQRSVSQYDVKNTVDIKRPPLSIWKEPPSRTVSAAALDMNSKEPTYKSTSTALGSPRFLKKSSKKIRSLLNIPEKKEGSSLTKENVIPKRGGSSDTIVTEEEEQRPNRERKVASQSGTANPTRSPTRLKMDKNHFADDLGKSSAPRFSTDELQQNPPARATSIRTQGQPTAIDERHERASLASGNWRSDQGGSSRLYSRFEPFCSFEKKEPHSLQSATDPAPIHALEKTKSMHSAKSNSNNEQHNHTGQQTTSHHENKLGKFIQRVGNFIHKNK